jgi:hypothetical protein
MMVRFTGRRLDNLPVAEKVMMILIIIFQCFKQLRVSEEQIKINSQIMMKKLKI